MSYNSAPVLLAMLSDVLAMIFCLRFLGPRKAETCYAASRLGCAICCLAYGVLRAARMERLVCLAFSFGVRGVAQEWPQRNVIISVAIAAKLRAESMCKLIDQGRGGRLAMMRGHHRVACVVASESTLSSLFGQLCCCCGG